MDTLQVDTEESLTPKESKMRGIPLHRNKGMASIILIQGSSVAENTQNGSTGYRD